MKETGSDPKQFADLRKQAEEILLGRPLDPGAVSSENLLRLLHELQVHQIELEVQNEELRRTQQELEASRDRYSDLYDLAPVGYLMVSENGLIVEANLAVAILLGVERSALVKQPLSRFIARDDQDAFYFHRKRAFETGTTQTAELRMVKADDTLFYARLESIVGQGEDCRTVIHDITQRARAEEALRESEQTARALLNAPTDVVTLIDTQGVILDMNETMARRFDTSADQLVGQCVWDLFLEEVATKRKARVEQVIQSRESLRYEDERQGIWNDNVLYPILNESGNVDRIAVIARDITEHKQAEELLREQNEFIIHVFESLAHPFYVVDANDYTVKMANSASYQGELPTAITCFALTHGRCTPCEENEHLCPIDEIKKTGKPVTTEHIHYDREGQRRIVEVHGHPIFDRDGTVTQIIEYTLDVTERRQAEIALEERTHELGERVKELNCLYGISALVEQPGISLEAILQGTAELISAAWQYPEITSARITLGSQEYRTEGFSETAVSQQAADIVVSGQRSGAVEICYLEERAAADEGPFLEEERRLINAIAERLGKITERMRAQAALRKSEQKYRQLIESAQEGVWTIDANARTTFVNPRMAEMLGYSIEEMLGKHLFSFMDERGVEISKQNLERRQQGISEQHDFEFMRKDGSRIYTSMETSPITDEAGNYDGALALVADITERRRAEDAQREVLRESRQREAEISALLQSSRAVLSYRDFELAARAIFESCKQLTGATAGYVALLTEDGTENKILFLDSGGHDCSVDPTLPMPIRGLREKAYTSGKTVYDNDFATSEWVEFLPHGHVNLENALFAPLVIKGITSGLLGLANKSGGFSENDARLATAFGELAAIALLNSQALESLQNSTERFRSVAQTAGEAIVTIDSQGRITFWNKAAETMFGYTPKETIGQPVTLIMPDRFRAAHQNGRQRVVTTGESRILGSTVEMAGLGKDGSEFPVELSLSTWKIKDEVFFTGLIKDISERRQAEERIQSLARFPSENRNPVLRVSQDGTILYANLASAPLLTEWGCQVSQKLPEKWRQLAADAIHSDESQTAEVDCQGRIFSIDFAPVQEAGYVNLYGRDITERKQAQEALSTLLDISHQVALTVEFEPLLNLILEQLEAVVEYDDATIFILEQGTLIPLAHRGSMSHEEMYRWRLPLEQARFAQRAILEQEVVILADVHSDGTLTQDMRDVLGERFETAYAQVRSWMGVPLTIKDQVTGILALQHSEREHFTPRQAELASAFANQAAVAIENNRLYEQTQELAALEERQRLARDLHDAVSQTLFSASLAAEVLPRLWEHKPEEGWRCLEELRHLTRSALAEMRTLLLELRPTALAEVELGDLLHQLVEAVTGRARLPVTLTIEGKCSLEPDVHVTLYRIAQEALSNVAKHAGASRATVSLTCIPAQPSARDGEMSEAVELRIDDDGQGFDPQSVPAERLGLCIMRERADTIDADIRIESQIGHGTQLVVEWPKP